MLGGLIRLIKESVSDLDWVRRDERIELFGEHTPHLAVTDEFTDDEQDLCSEVQYIWCCDRWFELGGKQNGIRRYA